MSATCWELPPVASYTLKLMLRALWKELCFLYAAAMKTMDVMFVGTRAKSTVTVSSSPSPCPVWLSPLCSSEPLPSGSRESRPASRTGSAPCIAMAMRSRSVPFF